MRALTALTLGKNPVPIEYLTEWAPHSSSGGFGKKNCLKLNDNIDNLTLNEIAKRFLRNAVRRV